MGDSYDDQATAIVDKARREWKAQPHRKTQTALDILLIEGISHALRNAAQPSLLEAEDPSPDFNIGNPDPHGRTKT